MITATISELLIVLSGLIIGVGYIQSSNLFPEPLSIMEKPDRTWDRTALKRYPLGFIKKHFCITESFGKSIMR